MTAPLAAAGVSAATAAAPAAAKATEQTEQAEGFERLLLGQLTKELVENAMPDDAESAAVTGAYKQMLPDALTEALMSGGGIGLAQKLSQGMSS